MKALKRMQQVFILYKIIKDNKINQTIEGVLEILTDFNSMYDKGIGLYYILEEYSMVEDYNRILYEKGWKDDNFIDI